MEHFLPMGQGPGRLGFPQTGIWGLRPRENKVECGRRLAAEACKPHPHRQKESGCSKDSVGEAALGQVTSQAWDPDPTGPAGHTLLQQEQPSTQGSLSLCLCLLIPLTWVAGNTRRGRNVPAKRGSGFSAFSDSLPQTA